jgi:cysteine desulfurase
MTSFLGIWDTVRTDQPLIYLECGHNRWLIVSILGVGRCERTGLAAIAGFGAAAAAADLTHAARMHSLRERLETGLKAAAPQAVIFGANARRLNTIAFAVPGIKAETAIIAFDLNGIAISSGSACSSGKVQTSHVLTAMGADPALVRGGMRVSLGSSTTDAEIEHFLRTWNVLAGSLLKGRSGIAA